MAIVRTKKRKTKGDKMSEFLLGFIFGALAFILGLLIFNVLKDSIGYWLDTKIWDHENRCNSKRRK